MPQHKERRSHHRPKPRPAAGRLFTAAVLLLGAAILYAPLAHGAVAPATLLGLDLILVGVVVCTVAALLVSRTYPKIPRWVLIPLGLINAQGWWMAINSKFAAVATGGTYFFSPGSPLLGFLPGSIDRASSMAIMLHVTVMSLAFAATCHLLSDRNRRWLVLKMIAIAGAVVAISGLYLKMTLSENLLWGKEASSRREFFAAFLYHGHAAAFLNLCWPAALVVLLRSLEKEENHLERAFWANSLVFTIVALFANTSQAGHGLCIIGLIVASILLAKKFTQQLASRTPILGAAALVAICIAGALLFNWASIQESWTRTFSYGGSLGGRFDAYKSGVEMFKSSPLFGTGPGTFGVGFDSFYLPMVEGAQSRLLWEHLHQDYLQTLIEWGLIGTASFAILFFGGFKRGLALTARVHKDFRLRGLSYNGAVIALGLTSIHMLIDFPLQIPALQLPFIVFVAMCWNAPSRSRTSK